MQNLKHLLEQAHADQNAFRKIYDMTVDRVFHYAILRVRNKEDAQDVVQEVYGSLWKSLPRFVYISDEHFYGFFWKVVRRRIFWFRLRTRSHVSLDTSLYDVPDEPEHHEDYRRLFREIARLQPKQRLVVELRYFSHLQFRDIAEMLGIQETHAKVLHHRAMKILKNHVQEYDFS